MELVFTKTFLKNLSKIQPLKRRKQIEILVFEKIPLIKSIEEIGIAEKLTGYDEFYKIRVGSTGSESQKAKVVFNLFGY